MLYMHLQMPLGRVPEWPFGVQNTPKRPMELKTTFKLFCNYFSSYLKRHFDAPSSLGAMFRGVYEIMNVLKNESF